MKIKIIFILVLAVSVSFLCVACTSSQNNSDVAHNDEEPVSNNEQQENNVPNNPEKSVELMIKVEPEEIALHDIPKFITIEVMNTSKDMEYRGGQGYSIDYYDGSDWNKIIIPAVSDEMIVIEPLGTLSFDFIQLQPDQYKYVSGKYRVCFNGEYYAEFTIK